MPTADQLYAQVRWEQEAINRGIRRYQEVATVVDPLTLSPGKALLRAVVPPLVDAVKAAQAEALDALLGGARPPMWARPILLLAPETIAVITASVLLRSVAARLVTPSAKAVAKACRDQVEYARWERAQQAEKVVGVWSPHDAFHKRHPNADTRAWRTWRKRVEGLEVEAWDESLQVAVGAHLIHLAVTASPDWLSLGTIKTPGKTVTKVFLSPQAEAVMLDLEQRAEVATPQRLPMIIPPLPWRYE